MYPLLRRPFTQSNHMFSLNKSLRANDSSVLALSIKWRPTLNYMEQSVEPNLWPLYLWKHRCHFPAFVNAPYYDEFLWPCLDHGADNVLMQPPLVRVRELTVYLCQLISALVSYNSRKTRPILDLLLCAIARQHPLWTRPPSWGPITLMSDRWSPHLYVWQSSSSCSFTSSSWVMKVTAIAETLLTSYKLLVLF
jgi:hypothetical protein